MGVEVLALPRLLFASLLTCFLQATLVSADHRYPRDLSKNGPWKTELTWLTASERSGFKINQNSAEIAISQAGVPTLAVVDGSLRAYFQWAPTDDENIKYFNHIGYSDFHDGVWSLPKPIEVDFDSRNPLNYPFDPTIVPLTEGGFRLYFTSNNAEKRGSKSNLSIGSATSADGVNFTREPGNRLQLDGKRINDCAIIYFNGKWHMIAPDHDQPGVGYYATSNDGLTFERQDDLFQSRGAWLGNMVERDGVVFFYGTGFTLKTSNFQRWQVVQRHRLADPGAAFFDGKMHVMSVGRSK